MVKRSDVTLASQKERRKSKIEGKYKEIIPKKFPKLAKDIESHIPKSPDRTSTLW